MNRKNLIFVLIMLMVGGLTAPVHAAANLGPLPQDGGPLPQVGVHIVQRGETLFSIARRYGLTVDGVAHANGIPDPRQIYVGQRLVIPGGEAENSAGETVPYLIQAGDTLASISRRYHTTWQTLAQINGLISPNSIHAGQVIQVPALDIPSAAPVDEEIAASSATTGGSALYVVRPQDTLFRIALRYSVPTWALASASRLADPALIYPGQELVIPGDDPGLLPAPFLFVQVQPLPVAQGMPMLVTVHTTEPVTLAGELFGQDVHFAREGNVYYGLVGVHVFTEPGLYQLSLSAVDEAGQETALSTGIIVQAGDFGYERIDLPANRSSLLDPTVIVAERDKLNALRSTFTPERHWTMPFQRPCVGVISSYFGTHRAYGDGPYTSYHSGIDFRAPGGTPVYAPAGGTVVLNEPLTIRGNAVIIDHGWGVLTGYWHLSASEVQVGQQLERGDLIGRVGNTGLSTGAHLHWEVWVGGISVDGRQLLDESPIAPASGHLAVGG